MIRVYTDRLWFVNVMLLVALLMLSQFVSGKVEMQDTHVKNQSVRAFELEEEHRVSCGFRRMIVAVNL